MRGSMKAPWTLVLAVAAAACAGEPDAADTAADADTTAAAVQPADAGAMQIACAPMSERMAIAGRTSPYDSTMIPVGGAQAKICYGRPSARGRTMLGGELPTGQLWRTGANEPTTIHLPVAASIAGVAVEPGSYSIYTVPAAAGSEWTVIVNRSTSQWGHEGSYTPEVEAQEAGRGTAPSEAMTDHVEQFTIRAEPAGQGATLILEWENTRVRIPVTPS